MCRSQHILTYHNIETGRYMHGKKSDESELFPLKLGRIKYNVCDLTTRYNTILSWYYANTLRNIVDTFFFLNIFSAFG